MKHGTKIEWLHIPGRKGETWNPWGGCSVAGPGCKNCWACRQANRFKNCRPQYKGTVQDGNWTGRLNLAPISVFHRPNHWRDPRAIFPCSMSDFFHEGADEWREHAWHTIYDTRQHLYLILTKRPERIPDCLPSFGKKEWPWKNVWLGATIENEDNLWRVDKLLNVEAAKRFLSLEPLLGNVYLRHLNYASWLKGRVPIDWVIAGGESGPGARPMHPDWPQSVRDQCQKAAVPFFFKQHGEWVSSPCERSVCGGPRCVTIWPDGHIGSGDSHANLGMPEHMHRIGKKRAGRLLDGRQWEEFPHEQTP